MKTLESELKLLDGDIWDYLIREDVITHACIGKNTIEARVSIGIVLPNRAVYSGERVIKLVLKRHEEEID